MKSTSQGKYWCFTVNLLNQDVIEDNDPIEFDPKTMDYLVVGLEYGEEFGRWHYQGYLELKTRQRMRGVKLALKCDRAHVEYRRGTAEEAAEYCKKDGVFEEYGEISKVAKSKKRLCDLTKEDFADPKKFAEENIGMYMVHHRGYHATRNLLFQNKEDYERHVVWIYGPPGSGKTRLIASRYGAERDNCKFTAGGFLLGYHGGEVAVFDDFRSAYMSLQDLLQITDRYACTVNVKGGEASWNARIVVFSGPLHPDHYMLRHFPDENPYQLFRRIKELINIEEYVPVPAPMELESDSATVSVELGTK